MRGLEQFERQRVLLAAWLAVLCLFASAAWAQPSRKVRVGVFDYFPVVYRDQFDHVHGFAIDLLEQVAKEENWELEYVYGTWAENIEWVEQGKVDLIIGAARTDEREAVMDFSREPLVHTWSEVFAQPSTQVHNVFDLDGRSIAMLRGELAVEQLRKDMEGFGVHCRYVELADYPSILAAVSAGQVDAGVVDNMFGPRRAADFGVQSTGVVFNPLSLRFAAPDQRYMEVLAAVDRDLFKWRNDADSLYYVSLAKWMAEGRGTEHAVPPWLWQTLAALGVVCCIAVAVSVLLRLKIRQATAALRRNERRLELALSATADAVWEWNVQTGDYYLSPRWYELLGYEDRAFTMTMDVWQSICHPDDFESAMANMGRLLEAPQGERTASEYRAKTKDGAWRWLLSRGSVVERDANGWPVLVAGTTTDISEHKRAEQALRESESRYRSLVDMTVDWVFQMDRRGVYTRASPSVTELIGYEESEVVGRARCAFMPPAEAMRCQEAYERAMAGNTRLTAFEDWVQAKGGRKVYFETNAVPLLDESGQVVGLFGTHRDVTRRRHDERLARLMVNELDHRVKNNLASILSLIRMGRQGDDPAKLVDTITGRIRAMALAHEALARHKWQGVRIRELIHALQPDADRPRLFVHGDDVELQPRIAGPVAMVLHELVTNAVKYGALTREQGCVDLQIDAVDHSVRVRWTERHGPRVEPPKHQGQGTQLIRGFIEHELGGAIELHYDPSGLRCEMTIPNPQAEFVPRDDDEDDDAEATA